MKKWLSLSFICIVLASLIATLSLRPTSVGALAPGGVTPTATSTPSATPTFTPTSTPTPTPTSTPTSPPPNTSEPEQPVLTITKRAEPTDVMPGDRVVFTIVVESQGPVAATGVVIEDELPPELAPISATVTQGTATTSGNRVTADVGTLGPGYGVTLTISALVRDDTPLGSTLENVALARSDQTPPVYAGATVRVAGLLPESGVGVRLWLAMILGVIGLIAVGWTAAKRRAAS